MNDALAFEPLKRCGRCRVVKPRSSFCRDARRKDGLQSKCKECARVYEQARDPSKERKRQARYRAENAELIAGKAKAKYLEAFEADPEGERAKRRATYEKQVAKDIDGYRERKKAYDKQYRADRCAELTVKDRERHARYCAADPEKWKAIGAEKRKRHAVARTADENKRRATKLNRTPAWADLKAIGLLYAECADKTRQTGILHHVDHIIPLQGKFVSGLHIAENLQILTASENCKKNNKYLGISGG